MQKSLSAAAAAAALITATTAEAQTAVVPPPVVLVPPPIPVQPSGSLYVQCDGQPNNMTAGESLARLVGAVTLLGIFAKPHEQPDPKKRLFGTAGVRACSQLIDGGSDGKGAEGNGLRRIPLILARALHHIEGKEYDQSIADVGKARGEATALNLAGNPYFERSMGLSFDIIEAYAWVLKGDYDKAREIGMSPQKRLPYSFYAAEVGHPYVFFNERPSAAEDSYYNGAERLVVSELHDHAQRLEGAGQFADAARLRDALLALDDGLDPNFSSIADLANAGVAHLLAGDAGTAEQDVARARGQLESRKEAGVAIPDRSLTVEILDLYDILKTARGGNAKSAREKFAARSEWTDVPPGMLRAVRTVLREGADPATLTGDLAKSEGDLFAAGRDELLASLLAHSKDNHTFFSYILPYAKVEDFERLSKIVWRADKSQLLSAQTDKNTQFYRIAINSDAMTQPDALLLHAALVAKARGYKGFVYIGSPRSPSVGFVRFGNPGDPGMAAPIYVDADAAIAELKEVIPSPETLKERLKVTS